MKKHEVKLQFLIMIFTLLFVSNSNAQESATSGDSNDSYVDNVGWSWTIDDKNSVRDNSEKGFRWWHDGGDRFSQLLMRLREIESTKQYTKVLEIPSSYENAMLSLSANTSEAALTDETVFPFIFLTRGQARSSIFYGKDNFLNLSINPTSPINSATFSYSNGFRFIDSNGTDITNNPNSYGRELMRIEKNGRVGIGTSRPETALHIRGDFTVQNLSAFQNSWDNFRVHVGEEMTSLVSSGDEEGMFFGSNTGNKITIGDGNDRLLLNGHKIFMDCDQVELTQVSMNTDKQVKGAVLTVAGATYIGPKAELATETALSKFNTKYLSDYNLWVETGVVSEDFAFAHVKEWRDDVFDAEYDLVTLEELKTYIDQNKHLPDVPSGQSVKENGYSAHQMNMILLQKIEELTLYTISLNEEIKKMKEELNRK